ncbi:hypothetical protein HMPREF9094_1954, partial [Fusobacterium animalis ATCC 51191]
EVQSKTDTEDELTNKLKNIQDKYGKDVVKDYKVEEPKGGEKKRNEKNRIYKRKI